MNENKLALITTLAAFAIVLVTMILFVSIAPSSPVSGIGANDEAT